MPQIVDLKNDRSISTNEEVVSAIQLARSFRYKAQTLTLHLREREKQRELVRPDIHGDYTLKNNKEYLITGEDMDPDQPNQDLSLVSLTARKRSVVALGDFEIKTICDGIPAQFDNMPFNLIILQAMIEKPFHQIAVHVVMLKRAVTDEKFVDRSLISERKPENTFKYIQNRNSLECATSEIVMGIIDCMAGGRSKMMLIASKAAITRNIFDSFILHQDDIARKADCLILKVAVEQMIDICMKEKDNFRAVYDKLLEFTQAVFGIVSSCSSEMKDFEKQSEQMEKNWERKRQEQKTLLESFTAETDKLLKALKEKDRADDMIKGKARGLIVRLMAAIMNPQKRLKKSMEKAEKKHKAVEVKILERQKNFEEATGLEKLLKGLFMKKNSLEGFTRIVVSMKSALDFLVNNWHSQCEYFALLKNLLSVLGTETGMFTTKQELGADYTKNMLSMTGNCRAVIAAAVMSNKVYDEYTLKILAGDNEAIDKIRDTKERKKVEEMIQEEKAKSCAIAIKDVKGLAEQMSKAHD